MRGIVGVDAKGYRLAGDDLTGRLLRVAAVVTGNLSFVPGGTILRKLVLLVVD